jgi:CDP-paratose 2-epimerase
LAAADERPPAPGTRVLITGGAGFIGSNLAIELATRHADWEIIALDNLHRRGSELNLVRLHEAGVRFVHGDVRRAEDVRAVGAFDKLVECAAETSVLAGIDGASDFLITTNMLGAYHCLQEAVRHNAQVVFLSTSRIYPIDELNALAYEETETRFVLSAEQHVVGACELGISEKFPLHGARTLYGASKLSAELLIVEYAEAFGLRTVINRCGVVAGPWQMGTAEQGVFAHWMLTFYFNGSLAYTGFGGAGKQVRDVLHVADLAELVDDQLMRPEAWSGAVINVGGGASANLSLQETTALCQELTGSTVDITSIAADRAGDIRIYVSDCRALEQYTKWRPARSARDVMSDIYGWVHEHEHSLSGVFTGAR